MRIVSDDGKRAASSSQCSVRNVQARGPRSRFVPAIRHHERGVLGADVVAERRRERAIHQRRVAEQRQRDQVAQLLLRRGRHRDRPPRTARSPSASPATATTLTAAAASAGSTRLAGTGLAFELARGGFSVGVGAQHAETLQQRAAQGAGEIGVVAPEPPSRGDPWRGPRGSRTNPRNRSRGLALDEAVAPAEAGQQRLPDGQVVFVAGTPAANRTNADAVGGSGAHRGPVVVDQARTVRGATPRRAGR